MIWQPEFTDKTLSRKPGAVQGTVKPVCGGELARRPQFPTYVLSQILLRVDHNGMIRLVNLFKIER